MSAEKKIAVLGIELPEMPITSPLVDHLMVKKSGDLLFVAGVGPCRRGKPSYTGRLVTGMKHEAGYEAAREAAVNALALIRTELGDLDRVGEIVKVTGYVASDDDFYDQHMILNGASHLFKDVFGERGEHVCTAVGVNVLPFNVPVLLDMVVRIKTDGGEEGK